LRGNDAGGVEQDAVEIEEDGGAGEGGHGVFASGDHCQGTTLILEDIEISHRASPRR
jgi:hypothetical protein